MGESDRETRIMEFESNKSDLKDAAEAMSTVLKTPSRDIAYAVKNLDAWIVFRTKLDAVESKGRSNGSDFPLIRQRILDEISAHIPRDIPKVDEKGTPHTLEQRLQLAQQKGPPISIDQVLGSLIDEIENPFRARLDAETGNLELIEPGLRYQLSKFPPFEKMNSAERTQYFQVIERLRIATSAADYLRLLATNTDRALEDIDREAKRVININFTPLRQGPQAPRSSAS